MEESSHSWIFSPRHWLARFQGAVIGTRCVFWNRRALRLLPEAQFVRRLDFPKDSQRAEKPHIFLKKRACIALRKFVRRFDSYDLNLTFPQVCRFVVRLVPAVRVFVRRVFSAAKPTTAYKEPEGADGAGTKGRECRKSAFRSNQGERRRSGNADALR